MGYARVVTQPLAEEELSISTITIGWIGKRAVSNSSNAQGGKIMGQD
jgi:hypothetical protein